jgi:hypothetical protein
MYNVLHRVRIGRVYQTTENPYARPQVAFVTALPKSANDPIQMRRAKSVVMLEEQKLLLAGPNHVRTVQRWTKVDGERQATTKQQAVRPWWKADPSGQVVMSIKFGAKPVEFEKGNAGIVVGLKEKLPAVIDR